MPNYPCHHVYCADIGSVETQDTKTRKLVNNFGWAGASVCAGEQRTSWHVQQASWRHNQEIQDLAKDVAGKLKEDAKVALGFECPLWVPVRDCPKRLTKARCGDVFLGLDGKKVPRAWSGGPGVGALVIGLAEVPWILREIRKNLQEPYPEVFLNWDLYQEAKHGLFIWEAFVSGKGKSVPHMTDAKAQPSPHVVDAKAAVRAFIKDLPSPGTSVHPCSQTLSLIGAAVLWSGLSKDLCLLHEPCIVINPQKSPD